MTARKTNTLILYTLFIKKITDTRCRSERQYL
jgi:hypothetical protein